MIGITGYGGYVPRLRLSRQAVGQANVWYAPQFASRKGTRAMAQLGRGQHHDGGGRRPRLPRPLG